MMPSRLALSLVLAVLCAARALPLAAQEDDTSDIAALEEAAGRVDEDLRNALDELAELRERIAEEKPELARETNRIAADLRETRREADLARTSRAAAEANAERREEELKTWRQERRYIENLLLDFRQTDLASRPPSQWEDPLTAGEEESWEALTATVESLVDAASISTAPGRALDENGVLVEGHFVEAGPAAWFVAEDGALAGLVTTDASLRPRVAPGTARAGEIENLIAGEPAAPRIDPTLGDAIALDETKSGIVEHIRKGGFWMIPILALAVVALLAALVKWVQLARIRALAPEAVQSVITHLNQGDSEAAHDAALRVRHPAGDILSRAAQLLKRDPDMDRDALEEALFERFLGAQPSLQRGLPLIAIASATAPLLGLLGTVTGMIETFRLINIFGTGDAKTLASGISEALVTTEFGLIVAIPALILHALLSRRVQGIKSSMEMTSLALLNGLRLEDQPPAARAEPAPTA